MTGRPLTGRDLPRLDGVPHPPRYLLTNPVLRRLARWDVARRYDVRVTGAERMPSHGPVVVAADHIGWLDGPLLAFELPREVHMLTKHEMFVGRTGAFLRHSGQISLDRFHPDPAAVKAALRVLHDGHVVGIFPEGGRGDGEVHRFHRGAAYLALASGAPVVPVAILGTRIPGGGADSRPPRGSRIDLVVGDPVPVAAQPWPRRREQVEDLSRLLQRHLQAHLGAARRTTGQTLPGPLPPTEHDPDPATALTDEPRPEENHD